MYRKKRCNKNVAIEFMLGVIFHWELNNREKTMCDIQLFGRLKEYLLATAFMVEQKWPWLRRTQISCHESPTNPPLSIQD